MFEYVNFCVTCMGAIGACATAYLMFIQLTIYRPTVEAEVTDVFGENLPLREKGYFLMRIRINPDPVNKVRLLKAIKIAGAEIPKTVRTHSGNWIGDKFKDCPEFHHGKTPVNLAVSPLHRCTFDLIFRPDNSEEGNLYLTTYWDRWTVIKSPFSYRKTKAVAYTLASGYRV